MILKEIGDREGEVLCFGSLGSFCNNFGDFDMVLDYYEKVFVISKDICDSFIEVVNYVNMGIVFESFGEYVKVEEYLKKGFVICERIGEVGN